MAVWFHTIIKTQQPILLNECILFNTYNILVKNA